MRKVLIISRCLPPLLDVGGKRAYRFAKYLPMFGWQPIVWTGPIPAGLPLDTMSVELTEGRVERTYYPKWWPQPHLTYTVAQAPIEKPGTAKRFLSRVTTIPLGRDFYLTPRAAIVLGRIIDREQVDAIFATSGPPTCLVYGWLISRLRGLPLCLDFRDPWSLNFLQRRKAKWVQAAEQRIEHFLMREAQRVVFSCEDAALAYRALYKDLPAEKITTIANSFDPVQRTEPQKSTSTIKLVHFGNCNGPRRLETVIKALGRIQRQGAWPAEGIRLVNFGRVRSTDVDLAATLGLASAFEYRQAIDTREGLRHLAESDLQILVNYDNETLYVPAKTFDYLITGKPILCLSRPSELTRFVTKTGAGRVVDPDDVAGTAAVIMSAIAARNGGAPVSSLNSAEIVAYDARTTAEKLASVLNAMVKVGISGP